jgi:hypothetical protein
MIALPLLKQDAVLLRAYKQLSCNKYVQLKVKYMYYNAVQESKVLWRKTVFVVIKQVDTFTLFEWSMHILSSKKVRQSKQAYIRTVARHKYKDS